MLHLMRVSSSAPRDPPQHAGADARLRTFLVHGHDAEIHDVQRIARRIETQSDGPLEPAAADAACRAVVVAVIDCEVVDPPVADVYADHAEADRMQRFTRHRRLVSELRDERLSAMTE